MSSPVPITATIVPVSPTAFETTFEIGTAPMKITGLLVGVEGGTDAAVRKARAATAFRNGFIFVREECGGGTTWDCSKEHVFSVNGGRVSKVGEFIVDDSNRRAGRSLQGAYFIDVYDKLEEEPLHLSHAENPQFEIALVLRDGRLHVDAQATWIRNHDIYETALAVVSRGLARGGKAASKREVLRWCADAIALAAYCNRAGDVERLKRRAETILSSNSMQVLNDIIDIVRPAELPSQWRAAKRNRR